MLRELQIRDVAIVEQLSVEFDAGFNVLSGETGAGKSIIIGALGLVLGARAATELVRTGCDSAEVVARFDRSDRVDETLAGLDLQLPVEDDGLLIRRVVTRAGRSRAYVGGTPVPVATLRLLAGELVDYASQHEHQVLLDEARHASILDRFGGLQAKAAAVADAITSLRSLLAERERLAALEREQRAREDWLIWQIDELGEANLQVGEVVEVEAELRQLGAAEDVARSAGEAAGFVGQDGAAGSLYRAIQRLERLLELHPELAPTLEGIDSALIAAQEAERELEQLASNSRANPRRLEELESRLARLRELARKHRCDADDLAGVLAGFEEERAALEGVTGRLESLGPEIEAARALCREVAGVLSAGRAKAATQLARGVEGELASLAMARARFAPVRESVEGDVGAVAVGEDGGGPWVTPTGAERVVFHLSANPGEEARPLAKVASGGELSRILLAIRRALPRAGGVQVCVFDEIDSGIGGEVADRVGEKLADIARDLQVLCITHLPQIASRADQQFRVVKEVTKGRTRTAVRRLDSDERVGEIVRMVGGTATPEAAAAFARELLGRPDEPARAGTLR